MTQQELLAAAGRLSKAAPSRAQTLELVSQERFFSTVLLMVVIPLLCFSLTLVLGETRTLWRYVPTKGAGHGRLQHVGDDNLPLGSLLMKRLAGRDSRHPYFDVDDDEDAASEQTDVSDTDT